MVKRELNTASDVLKRPDYPSRDYTSCSLSNKGLRDIADIRYYTNLESLDVSCNNILSLDPVISLTQLKVLIAKSNKVFNFSSENSSTLLLAFINSRSSKFNPSRTDRSFKQSDS